MSIKFSVVSRKNPRDLESPPKYYPSINSDDLADLRRIARRIGEISTVHSTDILASLEGLLTVLPQELADGNSVQLGDLGYFRLTAETEGAATPEEVTEENILKVHVRFKPGKLFEEALQKLEFKKIE